MHINIGTRGSRLALIQADIVKSMLLKLDPKLSIAIIPIQSEGDLKPETPLAELGGKGVFIKAIESALVNGTIDVAIHSLKDVTTAIDPSTQLVTFLNAESVSDAICMSTPFSIETAESEPLNLAQCLGYVPKNAVIATSSLRRQAQLAYHRPDLTVTPIRGNIDTRLERLHQDKWDALMLSEAGLIRINTPKSLHISLPPDQFIPAPGQGVITIQSRHGDPLTPLYRTLNHPLQSHISRLQLAIVSQLGMGCDYPLGLHTTYHEPHFHIQAFNADPKTLKGHYHTFTLAARYTPDDVQAVVDALR